MGLERRITSFTILDRILPWKKPQEDEWVTEEDTRFKLFHELEIDLVKLAEKSAQDQDELTAGYAVPDFKVGKRNYSLFMVREEDDFVVSDLRWKDDPALEDDLTPTNVIDFNGNVPTYLVQKPDLSKEDKYRRLAILPPTNSLPSLSEPVPAKLPLLDLQTVVNEIKQFIIEQQVTES